MPMLKNIRHELFAQALFKGLPQVQAALKAGYAPKWARSAASRLSTNVNIIKRKEELGAMVTSGSVMNVTERKEKLSEIGRADLIDFVVDGEPELKKDTPNRAAAAEFYKKHSYSQKGDPVVTKSIKLHNPMTAIDLLNRMERIYGEQAPPGDVIQNFVFVLPDGTRVMPAQLSKPKEITGGNKGNDG